LLDKDREADRQEKSVAAGQADVSAWVWLLINPRLSTPVGLIAKLASTF